MGENLLLNQIYRSIGWWGTMGGNRWVGGKSFKSKKRIGCKVGRKQVPRKNKNQEEKNWEGGRENIEL